MDFLFFFPSLKWVSNPQRLSWEGEKKRVFNWKQEKTKQKSIRKLTKISCLMKQSSISAYGCGGTKWPKDRKMGFLSVPCKGWFSFRTLHVRLPSTSESPDLAGRSPDYKSGCVRSLCCGDSCQHPAAALLWPSAARAPWSASRGTQSGAFKSTLRHLTSCGTLDKGFNLPGSQFPP